MSISIGIVVVSILVSSLMVLGLKVVWSSRSDTATGTCADDPAHTVNITHTPNYPGRFMEMFGCLIFGVGVAFAALAWAPDSVRNGMVEFVASHLPELKEGVDFEYDEATREITFFTRTIPPGLKVVTKDGIDKTIHEVNPREDLKVKVPEGKTSLDGWLFNPDNQTEGPLVTIKTE